MASGAARLKAELAGMTGPGNSVVARVEQAGVVDLGNDAAETAITVAWRGAQVPAYYLDSYTPVLGDTVLMVVQQGQLIVLGRIANNVVVPALLLTNNTDGPYRALITTENSGGDMGDAFTYVTRNADDTAFPQWYMAGYTNKFCVNVYRFGAVGWDIPAGQRTIGVRARMFNGEYGYWDSWWNPERSSDWPRCPLISVAFGDRNLIVGISPTYRYVLAEDSLGADVVLHDTSPPIDEWFTVAVGINLDTGHVAVHGYDRYDVSVFTYTTEIDTSVDDISQVTFGMDDKIVSYDPGPIETYPGLPAYLFFTNLLAQAEPL